ncbi:MAG: prepilin-type N-terminal cleavage/methylation domain-containing protein [Cycloclasticus sp.]
MKNLQTMKQNGQKGFTLIELMIVVAIIGILAALAIPAYKDYTIKARVNEGASVSGAVKTAMEVYWSEKGNLTNAYLSTSIFGHESLGVSTVASQYVSEISITGDTTFPRITVALRTLNDLGEASGKCFQYIPYIDGGQASNLTWAVAGEVAPSDAITASSTDVDKSTAFAASDIVVEAVGNNACAVADGIKSKYKPRR